MIKQLGIFAIPLLFLSACSSVNSSETWKAGLQEAFINSVETLESSNGQVFYSYDDSSKIGSFYKDGYTFSFFNADFEGLPKCDFKYLPVTNYKDVTPSILYYVTANNNIDELDSFIDIVVKEVGGENIFRNDVGYYIFNDLNETKYVLGFSIIEQKIASYWRIEWDKGRDALLKLVREGNPIYEEGTSSFRTQYYYSAPSLTTKLEESIGLEYSWMISNWERLNEFSLEGFTEYDDNGLQKSAVLTDIGQLYVIDNLSTQGLELYPVYEVTGGEALDDKGNTINCE